jgi:hypothetical protein
MKSVINLLIHCFPSLYFQGSVAHCLNLLLEDCEKAAWAKQIVKKAKAIVYLI